MQKKINIADDLIELKPYQLEDAKTQLENEDKEHWKWLSGGKSTLEGIENWILKNQENFKNNGPRFAFAIWDKSLNQIVGMVEFNEDYKSLEGVDEGEANISYGIYPRFRGKRYAAGAVNLVCELLRERGIKNAVIRVEPENINSIKVAERAGFKKVDSIKTKDNKTLVVYNKSTI